LNLKRICIDIRRLVGDAQTIAVRRNPIPHTIKNAGKI
jgi:hypothetical protein